MGRTVRENATGDARWKLVAALLAFAALCVLGSIIADAAPVGPLPSIALHSVFEAVSGSACIAVAVLLLLLRRSTPESWFYVFPAAGLLGMGILDLFHAAVPASNAFVWLRACASIAGGAGFVLLVLPARVGRARAAEVLPFAFGVGAVAVGVLSILVQAHLPRLVLDDGSFSRVARAMEAGASALFALAMLRLLEGQRARPPSDVVLLTSFCLLQATASFLFPWSRLWLLSWWWWHLLRVIAAVVLLAYALRLYARLEAQLRQAVVARDEFLSLAAHDLKTPVTAVRLNAQLMLRAVERPRIGVDALADTKARTRKLIAQLDRLTVLVDELLDVAKARAGRLTLRPEVSDLAQIVGRTLDELAPEIAAAGCPLEADLAAGVRGCWDAVRITQVLANLLTNAARFGAGKPVRVEVARADGHARISVHDSGIGIARSDQTRIFERYERAVSPRTHAGLGLGLYIAREIVRAHGGRIWVDSEPGAGATFVVELPCERPS